MVDVDVDADAAIGERAFSPGNLAAFYRQRFKVDLALQVAYRGATFIWLFSLIVQPLVSLVVWRTVADSQGGSAGGYTAGEYAAYFIAVMVVNQLTFMWHMWEIEWRVRTGVYSGILLRPMHPIHEDLVANLAFKAFTMVPLVPICVVLGILFDAQFETRPMDIVAFVPAVILALGIRYTIEWALGLIAFWITRAAAIHQLWASVTFFLAGQMAPLSLFPKPIQVIATVLPFRWMLSFPVEVLLGRLSGREILAGLGVQVVWLAIAIVIMRAVWSRAASRYSAVGG
ncbi:MAG TPA: ABC-2 family transporter protein [Thermomicrobiales bacterium]|nr:ABC-2 family transporter protein [Thermomicrobiales bacterium]